MEIADLLFLQEKHPQLNKFLAWFGANKNNHIWLKGLAGSYGAVFFSSVFHDLNRSVAFVLDNQEDAAYFYNDLVQITGGLDVYFFPSSYKRGIKYGEKDPGNEVMRTETLNALDVSGSPVMVVTYPEALFEQVVSTEALHTKTLSVSVGQRVTMSAVKMELVKFGFEQVDFVFQPGQFSVRGSILDVFSYSSDFPFRIDFFGDEVDSIRTFEVDNQLSKEKKEKVSVVSDVNSGSNDIVPFLQFISKDTLLAFSDYNYASGCMKNLDEENAGFEKAFNYDGFLEQVATFKIAEFGLHNAFTGSAVLEFHISPQPLFNKNFDLIADNFQQMLADKYKIYVMAANTHQTDRLKAIFGDMQRAISFTPVQKTLHQGFVDNDLRICCYTDHQIFDRFHKYSLSSERARAGKAAMTLKMLKTLQVGDYVAHIDFGIGKFGGLMTMDISGKKQEVIKLVYKDDDLVFISIHSLHKISKYRGKEGEEPRINKLGTGAWQALKDRTKKKVKDIARDLIALYARRRQERGFAFSPDSFLQQELESSFIYEDTPDQLKATADVKKDMEKDEPMDRLICGDVGFGKTEIAIRAAYKAVADNKQVAVLVPTTVLAFQHYQTFSERLKGMACRVDYLSRTRSAKATREVLKDLADGKINIVIGTHKLIGKSVKFHDLGLLVIDEEQKFGVSTKEKIRQMKVNVDTLTLTATPIPRTLQFSLMGARDLSIMTTPPPNRYPVQTELSVFSEEVISEAIKYELGRNGQVFFVSNKIASLLPLKEMINRLVPSARVVIGHGQMPGEDLEKVVLDFLNFDYDILLSTSIIESGIDISNCNTIIINDAQNFGLSDLHQLRGRVGRSNRRAFCYLLSPPLSALPDESRRRLETIEMFSDLGSGFNIAMQDLDIRGAGNLLGAEQSGFIADLGYETYHKILNEAVDELKNEEFADIYASENSEVAENETFVSDCQMETDMELMFPAEYISNVSERMNLYRDLDNVKDEAEMQKFQDNLVDRFGPIPEQALNLMSLVRLRWLAIGLGFEKLVLKNERMTAFLIQSQNSPYFNSQVFGNIIDYVVSHPAQCTFKGSDNRAIVFNGVSCVNDAIAILQTIVGK
ncbi:MAG: transcription-repair coupling factor [Paludibacteraceae bacterium]|nr:transcription-repair coupling factor [Paludibacteraceae bacterium]MBR6043486.1 transcription-repair coupling factor [Paludibacteraceae bacterium]